MRPSGGHAVLAMFDHPQPASPVAVTNANLIWDQFLELSAKVEFVTTTFSYHLPINAGNHWRSWPTKLCSWAAWFLISYYFSYCSTHLTTIYRDYWTASHTFDEILSSFPLQFQVRAF